MTAVAPPENPFAGQGPVLLDIGEDVGALVIFMPVRMASVEIEIRPINRDGTRAHRHRSDRAHAHYPHVAVVGRPAGGRTLWSAVFPDLTEGAYELYQRGTGRVELTVTVTGGAVTQASWPD
jgi:hypothetical protein